MKLKDAKSLRFDEVPPVDNFLFGLYYQFVDCAGILIHGRKTFIMMKQKEKQNNMLYMD